MKVLVYPYRYRKYRLLYCIQMQTRKQNAINKKGMMEQPEGTTSLPLWYIQELNGTYFIIGASGKWIPP